MSHNWRIRWRLHHLVWRLSWRNFRTRLFSGWHHFIEWDIKSRFGRGLWRRTRFMRIVPRVVDNKPVWTLCHDEKAFFGWRKVDIATAPTAEELVPLADHRMQSAKFLRVKDGKYTTEPESAWQQVATMAVKIKFNEWKEDGGNWEVVDDTQGEANAHSDETNRRDGEHRGEREVHSAGGEGQSGEAGDHCAERGPGAS